MLMTPKYNTQYLHNYSTTTGYCYVDVISFIDIYSQEGKWVNGSMCRTFYKIDFLEQVEIQLFRVRT